MGDFDPVYGTDNKLIQYNQIDIYYNDDGSIRGIGPEGEVDEQEYLYNEANGDYHVLIQTLTSVS